MATKVKKVNNDEGVQETDNLIAKLEKDINKEYQLAYEGVSEKLNKYMESFFDKDQKKRDLVSSGAISKEEYNQWRMGQIAIGKRWKAMQDTLAQDLVLADKKAASIVNGFTPQAYALNHNYATYEIEKNTEINTSYTLYNASAVERLIDKKPNLLPKARVDIPKDKKWNQNKINSAVTQGILQGDDLKSISKRLQTVTDMDANAAMRNARTMMTGAQNAGRLDAYKRASKMGIDIQKEWMSTLDMHTRESHRMLDGERRSLDETFSNGLMYPGDTRNGSPEEVYNCRCTLVPYYPEYPEGDYERYDNIAGKAIKYVAFVEWLKSKKGTVQKNKPIKNIFEDNKININLSGIKEDEVRKTTKENWALLTGINEFDGETSVKIKADMNRHKVTVTAESSNEYVKIIIYDDKKEIYLDLIHLNETGTGKGTKILNEIVDEAEKQGFEKITAIAAGDAEMEDGDYNGFYSLARFGFDGKLNEQQKKKAREAGFNVNTVQELMSTEKGRLWWKRHGSIFEAEYIIKKKKG